MNRNAARLLTGPLALALAVLLLAGVSGAPPTLPPHRVVPDVASRSLVREANEFIQKTLNDARMAVSANTLDTGLIRANALLIALVAQNRMADPTAEVRRLATLRDAALRLAEAAREKPPDRDRLFRLAEPLGRFPDLATDPQSRPDRYRLADRFDHDDVEGLFGGCGGHRGHAIQFTLRKSVRQQTPYTPAEREKLKLLAYKAALVAGLLRDFDVVPLVHSTEQSKEWVRRAVAAEYEAWELAHVARPGTNEAVKTALHRLNGACTDCHNRSSR